ncbi:MAG TPA: class I SAM-dependent methyltransferase [Saprospiraceae bacterium]|nr:class I SAM-dependent methyltransferase [Saprospiraceae bacterium]
MIKFICPECKSDLNSNEFEFKCKNCEKQFPIINKIPRFVDQDNYTSNFGFQWNLFSKTQLDSYCSIELSKNRVEEVLGNSLEVLSCKTVLEAGSGAGRFTEIFLNSNCELYSFDYSNAVEANSMNNADQFTLFQGNIYKMPLSESQFDFVFCLGVIQHTPDPIQSLDELHKQVKIGGQLCIDVYEKRAYSFLTWKYLLRPLFKILPKKWTYQLSKFMVYCFLPFSTLMGFVFGKIGHKLFPIANFFIVPFKSYHDRLIWSILDTFDWYGPEYDLPQTQETIRTWFLEKNYKDIVVKRGSNGVIARAIKMQ